MKLKDKIILALILVILTPFIGYTARMIIVSTGDRIFFQNVTRYGVDDMAGVGLDGDDTSLWLDMDEIDTGVQLLTVTHPIQKTGTEDQPDISFADTYTYTQAEIIAYLLDKADTPHDHNNLYYTETESDTLLLAKADTPHAHDDRYYTETELSDPTGSALIGHDTGHTVKDTFDSIINRGKSSAITVSLTGGLGISWTSGELYDKANTLFISTDAGSGNLTDNLLNYLKWVSGTALTISTSTASDDEILVARFSVYDGVINGYRETSLMSETIGNARRGMRALFPNRIISGMSVSEDTDATNPLDVTMDAGELWKDGIEQKTPVEINSRDTELIRHFHTGGVADYDTDIQIETTNYDNGTDLTAIPSNKWVKSYFIFMNNKIGWVYPTAYHNTKAQALDDSLPTMPAGLDPIPKLTAIVYQQGDANFTSATWQDIRAGISEESFNIVTDHGALAGLSDDDHTQYHTDARGDLRYTALADSALHYHNDHYGLQGGTAGEYYHLTASKYGIVDASDADSYLDAGQKADINSNTSARHTQGTDDDLDATFEATFVKKADTVNVLSDITSTGANIEDAVTKKHASGSDNQNLWEEIRTDTGTTSANTTTDVLWITGGTDVQVTNSGDTIVIDYTGTGGAGDMTKAVYDSDDDGKIAEAQLKLDIATMTLWKNTQFNAFRIGNYEYMIDGFTNDFTVENEGIDTTNSDTYLYNAAGDYYYQDTGSGEPATLVYWSKLESAGDITSPQVGVGGTVDGSPTYATCKFNNGLYCDAAGEAYHVPNTGSFLSGNEGTVECWIKTDFNLVNGVPDDATTSYVIQGNPAGSALFGYGEFGASGMGLNRRNDDAGWISCFDTTTDWTAGDLVHIAFVWDINAGFDGTKTMAVYVNGVETANTSNALGAYTDDETNFCVTADDGLSVSLNSIIDNLKIWDYGKIDFSDRNTEGYSTDEGNMELYTSENYDIGLTPTTVKAMILSNDEPDTVYLSRLGTGTTLTQAILSDSDVYDDTYYSFNYSASVSGEASDTCIRCKIVVESDTTVYLYGISLMGTL